MAVTPQAMAAPARAARLRAWDVELSAVGPVHPCKDGERRGETEKLVPLPIGEIEVRSGERGVKIGRAFDDALLREREDRRDKYGSEAEPKRSVGAARLDRPENECEGGSVDRHERMEAEGDCEGERGQAWTAFQHSSEQ